MGRPLQGSAFSFPENPPPADLAEEQDAAGRRRLVTPVARISLLIALLAPLLFVALASPRLGAPGLNFDEVHHACASFAVLGKTPELFVHRTLGSIPVFVLSYNGALRPLSFGLLMLALGEPFSVELWRGSSIALAALGILALGLVARRKLRVGILAALLGFVVTDVSLLLSARHDWGPFSMLFALRMVWLGLWIRWGDSVAGSPRKAALLSAIAGLAAYEKLSAVVFVVAQFALLLAGGVKPKRRVLAAAALGGLLTLSPVIVANAQAMLSSGRPFAVQSMSGDVWRSPSTRVTQLRDALSLSVDPAFRAAMVGARAAPWERTLELCFSISALALAAAAWRRGAPPEARRAALLLLVVAGGIALLPGVTQAHHWTMVPPLVPLLFLLSCFPPNAPRARRFRPAALLLAAWLVFRGVAVAGLEASFVAGDTGPAFLPEYTRVARLAAGEGDRAAFIVGSWGLATQIYCVGNGRPGLVRELWWEYAGPKRLKEQLPKDGRAVMLLDVVPDPIPGSRSSAPRILRAMRRDPAWREVPPPAEWQELSSVDSWRFEPVSPAR
jgi:hypothetical protein